MYCIEARSYYTKSIILNFSQIRKMNAEEKMAQTRFEPFRRIISYPDEKQESF